MLPVVDKPLIQYAVEEAIAAGSPNDLHHRQFKRAIEDHFDTNEELEAELEGARQAKAARSLHGIMPS